MVSIPSVTGVASDVGRTFLLPPLRLVREASVAVARTTRHWELVVAGEDPQMRARLRLALDERLHALDTAGREEEPSTAPAPEKRTASARADAAEDEPAPEPSGAEALDLRDLPSDDLPVEDWPQLSFADAQARTSGCTRSDLEMLLAYERDHGHRMQFELMLKDRLSHLAS